MILIVDSGSTKTDWCFLESAGRCSVVTTGGMNPAVQDTDELCVVVGQLDAEMPKYGIRRESIAEVHFYGAGCTDSLRGTMQMVLRGEFGQAAISVESDLMAAARALCGHSAGLACILGTGANSCVYDGLAIVRHTPALGFILGDEGSGAVLGRKFVNAIIKGGLPYELRDDFFREYDTSTDDIINHVYHQPQPNRFLASTAKFIAAHMPDGQLEELVVDNFRDFIIKNLQPYGDAYRVINAVGSIAFYFREQLGTAARQLGYELGIIHKSPMNNLIKYHLDL